jgi:hypothetical protein
MAICCKLRASGTSLSQFYDDGTNSRVGELLELMKEASRAIKPRDLGVIGKEHLASKFAAAGAAPDSFDYRCAAFEHEGLPYVVEAAFGYCPSGPDERRIITGINWSPAIGADPFRSLGTYDESLSSILTEKRAGRSEPIVTVLHLACPRVDYLDRGKSAVSLPNEPSEKIIAIIKGVTAKWCKQRKAEEKAESARLRREERMIRYARPMSIRDAPFEVMEEAYLKASANNTLPASARQTMYAARPQILALSERDWLDDAAFAAGGNSGGGQSRHFAWQKAPDQTDLPAAQLRGAACLFAHAEYANDEFFVRYHLADIPQVCVDDWKLSLGGPGANGDSEIGFAELKKLPAFEVVAVCQCSGNRRGFFEPHVAGVQWGYGAIGCARWKGARLKDLLDLVELKKEAVEIVFDGADGPSSTRRRIS